MPELPEVEYERRRLQRAMARARVDRVLTRREKLRYAFPPDFSRRLEGQIVRRVTRRAKYLLVELGSGDVLLMHLGMSGSFRIIRRRVATKRSDEKRAANNEYETHDHVVFFMSNGATVVFNDPRRFGFMTLLAGGRAEQHKAVARLGPEPLASRFDASALTQALRRRKTSLKIALSDQRVVAGLGNIYVSEALHRARLSPKRRASSMVTRGGEPRPSLHELVTAIREALKTAIRNQHRTGADDPFLVYGRDGKRCLRRGCGGTIRRIVQGGRSTFYCPVCQR